MDVPYGCPQRPQDCTCGVGNANLDIEAKVTSFGTSTVEATVTVTMVVTVYNHGTQATSGRIQVKATPVGGSPQTFNIDTAIQPGGSTPATFTFSLAALVNVDISTTYNNGATINMPTLVPNPATLQRTPLPGNRNPMAKSR